MPDYILMIEKQPISLYKLRLKKDDVLRIPGNADQGKPVKSGMNLIIFARAEVAKTLPEH